MPDYPVRQSLATSLFGICTGSKLIKREKASGDLDCATAAYNSKYAWNYEWVKIDLCGVLLRLLGKDLRMEVSSSAKVCIILTKNFP